jgi:hypothetical protein
LKEGGGVGLRALQGREVGHVLAEAFNALANAVLARVALYQVGVVELHLAAQPVGLLA